MNSLEITYSLAADPPPAMSPQVYEERLSLAWHELLRSSPGEFEAQTFLEAHLGTATCNGPTAALGKPVNVPGRSATLLLSRGCERLGGHTSRSRIGRVSAANWRRTRAPALLCGSRRPASAGRYAPNSSGASRSDAPCATLAITRTHERSGITGAG